LWVRRSSKPEKPWRIDFLSQGTTAATTPGLNSFRDGMKELGYAEGQKYVLQVRQADGRSERLPGLAAELVGLPVDVLVVPSTPSALAAMQATRAIPIVTVTVADPVGSGLVQSLSRPGGNVTGLALALDEVSHKWLELLQTVCGGRLSRVAFSKTRRTVACQPCFDRSRARRVRSTPH
jgi:putative ABC transport system substrate-binding protein